MRLVETMRRIVPSQDFDRQELGRRVDQTLTRFLVLADPSARSRLTAIGGQAANLPRHVDAVIAFAPSIGPLAGSQSRVFEEITRNLDAAVNALSTAVQAVQQDEERQGQRLRAAMDREAEEAGAAAAALGLSGGFLLFLARRGRNRSIIAASRAEQARSDTLRRFQSLATAIDILPNGFALWDSAGRSLLANQAYRDLFGSPTRPDFGEEKESRTVELADGRWVAVEERRLLNGGLVGLYADATDRMKRETHFARTLGDLQAALDGLDRGFALIDGEAKLIRANSQFYDLFSMEAKGPVGFERAVDAGEEDADILATRAPELKTAVVAGQRWAGDINIAGRTIAMSLSPAAPGVFSVLARDDSAWQEAEAALRAREEAAMAESRRQTDALDRTPAGIIVFDAEGQVRLANARLREMLPTLAGLLTAGGSRADINAQTGSVGFAANEHGDEPTLFTEFGTFVRRDFRLADGRWLRVFSNGDSSGQTDIVLDVTDLAIAASTANERIRLLEVAIQSMPAFVGIDDAAGATTLSNGQLSKISGALTPGRQHIEAPDGRARTLDVARIELSVPDQGEIGRLTFGLDVTDAVRHAELLGRRATMWAAIGETAKRLQHDETWRNGAEVLLAALGAGLHADRVFLMPGDGDSDLQWAAPGIEPLGESPRGSVPHQSEIGSAVLFGRKSLRLNLVSGENVAMLGADAAESDPDWDAGDIGAFEAVGAAISAAMDRADLRRRRHVEGDSIRQILDAAPIALLAARTSDWAIVFANPAAATLLGEDPAAEGGRGLNALVENREEFRRLMTAADPSTVHVRRSGAVFLAQAMAAHTSLQGSPVVIVCLADVDEEENAARKLRADHKRLVEAIEALDEGIAVFDRERRLVASNAAFRSLPAGDALDESGSGHGVVLPDGISPKLSTYPTVDGGSVVLALKPQEVPEPRKETPDMGERATLAIEGAGDGVWDWDLKTGRIWFSRRWREMIGDHSGDGIGVPAAWFDEVHSGDVDGLKAALSAMTGAAQRVRHEYKVLHADGSYRWMIARGAATNDADGHAIRLTGLQTDLSTDKEREARLLAGSLTDSLTQMPTRAVFLDRVARVAERAARVRGSRFAVLIAEIQDLADIRDDIGQWNLDAVLISAAGRVKACLRPGDSPARLGADSFAVLFEDLESPDEVGAVVDRMRGILSQPFDVGERRVVLKSIIGVAVGPGSDQRPDAAMLAAELAVLSARAAPSLAARIVDMSQDRHAISGPSADEDLGAAIRAGAIVPYYQPVIEIASGRAIGFEALARWRQPRRGLLGPARFLNDASRLALIPDLDLCLTNAAAQQLQAWRSADDGFTDLTVSINLSPETLSNADAFDRVLRLIEGLPLPPARLEFEIADATIAADPERVVRELGRLGRLGVGLCVDDFAGGRATLEDLCRLPVTAVKLDRAIIRHRAGAVGSDRRARGVIELARHLGFRIVAKGVETQAESVLLAGLGCLYAQGNYYSAPVSAEAAEAIVAGMAKTLP